MRASVAVKTAADDPIKAETPHHPGGSFINESM
jgi:hypothetical protein